MPPNQNPEQPSSTNPSDPTPLHVNANQADNSSQVIDPQHASGKPLFAPDSQPASLSKKRRLPKILLIVALVLVLLGSGGTYAYWQIMNNRPEKVLADAISHTLSDVLDRKPITYIGSLVYEDTGDRPYKVTVDFDAKSADDKYETAATIRVEAEGKDISFYGSVIVIDSQEVYIKFENTVKTANDIAAAYPDYEPWIDLFMPLLEKIDSQWIKIDSGGVSETGLVADDQEEIDACSQAVKALRLSSDDQEAVKDIFGRHPFAIATEKHENEAIEGEDSYHYKLDLNEHESTEFYNELIELQSFASVKKECDIKPSETSEHTGEDLPEPVMELWVGTETRRPTKLRITANDKSLTSKFETIVKIGAQDITVEAPQDFINLTDLVQEFEDLSANVGL